MNSMIHVREDRVRTIGQVEGGGKWRLFSAVE